MNVSFTQKPTRDEEFKALRVSEKAKQLVDEFGSESSNGNEFDNRMNIERTKTRLLAYIADLERS